MSISQFSNEVDDILRHINKLYQQSSSADFNEHQYAQEVARLQEHFDDIEKVVTKDEIGNPLTDEDGKKIFTAADLLELDRQEHIYKIAKEKLVLLEKISFSNFNEQIRAAIHKEYASLQAKEDFFAGKANDLLQHLDSSTIDVDNVALVMGPLNKNVFTDQYEELVKGMIRGNTFQLIKHPQTNEYTVKMEGKEYHLTNILKFANLTHLTFDQQDFDNYLTMLATQPMAYKPDVDQSDAARLAPIRGKINADKTLTSEEKKRKINGLIDQILLQSIDKQNEEKAVSERDTSLAEISTAERLAINIWTTGFFDCANPFLRGDIEGTFERTRVMSDLVGGCSLRLMSDLPASGPEAGKLYLSKNSEGQLIYTVRTPQNVVEQNQLLSMKGITLPPGVLTLEILDKYKDQILAETSKRGHTSIKENGREDALRELLCTTAFVMHGASHVSANVPINQQQMFRGDDGLHDPVLKQRINAAQNQNVISLNSITSTAKENPNVDFAFNNKPENVDKVKVGSIHTAIGKDISAISAFKRENEFISVSRHKQYEAVLQTSENEYLFKVRDVTALNQLSPEELLSKSELAELDKREKELTKQEKSILASISKSKRKKIQSQKNANQSKRSDLIQQKREYLSEIANLRKSNKHNSEPVAQSAKVSPTAPDSNLEVHSLKRKHNNGSIEETLKNAEKYIAKRIRIVKEMVIPSSAHETQHTAPLPAKENIVPSGVHQPSHNPQEQPEKGSNPLMLPESQLEHLKHLENELNQQPALPNSRGNLDHLLIRQFQIDTKESGKPKSSSATTAPAIEDEQHSSHDKPR